MAIATLMNSGRRKNKGVWDPFFGLRRSGRKPAQRGALGALTSVGLFDKILVYCPLSLDSDRCFPHSSMGPGD